MGKKKSKQMQRLNVVPILDAVFIFIFYLVLSAKFIKFSEINAKKPVIEEVSSGTAQDSLKSKNFRVKLYLDKIVVTEGLKQKVLTLQDWSDASLDTLKTYLVKLKKDNPKESAVIIQPHKKLEYSKIVTIIDLVQQYVDSKATETGKLFRSIAFENLE